MGIDAIIVLLILIAILIALAFTHIAPDAILVGGLTLMLIVPVPVAEGWRLGVLSATEAIAGFSNPGLATVAVLFIVVEGLRETGAIDWMAQGVLGRPRGVRRALGRFVVPVCGVSAFVNNTPLVAMLIPVISDWSKKLGLPPSKLMIPLSYASILGGTCSLIGTSTNLVVAGLVVAHTELPPLRMFDITPVGVPCALLGCVFLLTVGPSLLPSRGSAASVLADPREYTMELLVPAGSPLAGRTVEQAGLRNLPGCYLVEIDREGDLIAAVGPDQVLRVGDRLLFTGIVDSIRDLANLRGLAPATNQVFKLDAPRYRRRLFEAVVSSSCPLSGKTIREGRFRTHYEGAVIAVARNGERVRGKIGDIELQPGDTLLIEASPRFGEKLRNSRDFLLVSALDNSAPRRHARAPIALLILLGMVVLAASGLTTMLVAGLVAGGLMLVTGCSTVSEARRSVDWSVLIVIGTALGIGEALTATDAAGVLAREVLAIAGSNPWMALGAIYVITAIVTAIISNSAAVAITFPIAQATAANLDVNFMPFVITVMMAGSACFATPLGYQTNLMVYGPGGYRLTDFLRIGLPMNLLMGLATVGLTPLVFKFE